MSEEAGRNVMLYFFEVLMKADHPLPINHLVGHFTRRRFSNDMRIAVGGSDLGLKALLVKFPSIFAINGNFVGLTDWQGDDNRLSQESLDSDVLSRGVKKNTFIPNVSAEMEAVRFFQDKFVKRSSREMQVRSLAGHLSQASSSIRRVVGPQLQFKTWLQKHPHIFEVEEDIVKLQDDVAALILDVEMAESELICNNGASSGTAKSKAEIMAIVFLGDLIKQHQGLHVDNIEDHIRLAPTTVRNFINHNNINNFVSDNSTFFQVEEGVLKEVKSPCSNLVRTNEFDKVEITEDEVRAGAIVGKGRIYHIAKLWGIIDLGQHDHVFFDRSILPKATMDMKKEFKVGQILSFKALPAPKTSRAKWKALSVWKPSFANASDYTEKEEESSKVEEEIYRLVLADHQMVDDLLNSDEEAAWINDVVNENNLNSNLNNNKDNNYNLNNNKESSFNLNNNKESSFNLNSNKSSLSQPSPNPLRKNINDLNASSTTIYNNHSDINGNVDNNHHLHKINNNLDFVNNNIANNNTSIVNHNSYNLDKNSFLNSNNINYNNYLRNNHINDNNNHINNIIHNNTIHTNNIIKNNDTNTIHTKNNTIHTNNTNYNTFLCSVSCQTESTGDIIATQLYTA